MTLSLLCAIALIFAMCLTLSFMALAIILRAKHEHIITEMNHQHNLRTQEIREEWTQRTRHETKIRELDNAYFQQNG